MLPMNILSEGIEGFTELFKNRVVIQFMGSYKKLQASYSSRTYTCCNE